MNFQCDITEQYLTKMYEDLQQHQMKLMNDVKTSPDMCNEKKQALITRQITQINSINMGILKLKAIKKKIYENN